MEERNKVTPDYFYTEVSKKVGVPRELVKDIYEKYLARVKQCTKADVKVIMKGLGTIEANPKGLLANLHAFNRYYDRSADLFLNNQLPPATYKYIQKTSVIIKRLNQTLKKYVFLKKYFEYFWRNPGGINELFDNQGNCRRDFRIQDENLRELPIQFRICTNKRRIQANVWQELRTLFNEKRLSLCEVQLQLTPQNQVSLLQVSSGQVEEGSN